MNNTKEASKKEMIAYIEKLTIENECLREVINKEQAQQLNLPDVGRSTVFMNPKD